MQRRLIPIGILFFVLTLASASPVLAEICCKCNPPEDQTKGICIKTKKTDCASLAQSSNSDVKSLKNCTVLPNEANCAAVGDGGGVCVGAPKEESGYKAQKAAPSGQSVPVDIEPPKLNIPIPGLTFASQVSEQNGELVIPFFAQYIAAGYRYLIGISIVAAAIMIVYGGFRYITGSALGTIAGAKEIITDATIGLVLVLGSATILATVNPDTMNLSGIRVQVIKSQEHVQVVPVNYQPQTAGSSPSGGAGAPSFEPLSGPPPSSAGSFQLPPTPGSKGWIENGNCAFELNQAGVPTVLSMYRCAIETVAKEQGIDACYLVTAIGKETYLGLTNIVGHDENAKGKPRLSTLTMFPERQKFVASGITYLKKTFPKQFISDSKDDKSPLNDDHIDLSRPDLGLDPRYSHGFGIGLTKIPGGCPIDTDKRKWIEPYFAIKGGAQWIKCTLDGQLQAMQYQTYPGTVYNLWQRWGGCYAPGGVAGKCVDFAKDHKGYVGRPDGYAGWTITCMKNQDPYKAIYKGQFTICRGDLPLDREQCKEYVETYLKDLGVLPNSACNVQCFDQRMPIQCVPGTRCRQLQVNPSYQHRT